MQKYVILAAMIIVSAMTFPDRITALLDKQHQDEGKQTQQVSVTQSEEISKNNQQNVYGRKAYIKMDSRGHFITDARLNGRKLKVLVDTGATMVAINESTARRLGIKLANADFKYTMSTANGTTKAALTTIKEIEIGRVRVKNVQASVSRDEALDIILLGMTFLKELDKFEIESGELILTE